MEEEASLCRSVCQAAWLFQSDHLVQRLRSTLSGLVLQSHSGLFPLPSIATPRAVTSPTLFPPSLPPFRLRGRQRPPPARPSGVLLRRAPPLLRQRRRRREDHQQEEEPQTGTEDGRRQFQAPCLNGFSPCCPPDLTWSLHMRCRLSLVSNFVQSCTGTKSFCLMETFEGTLPFQ